MTYCIDGFDVHNLLIFKYHIFEDMPLYFALIDFSSHITCQNKNIRPRYKYLGTYMELETMK